MNTLNILESLVIDTKLTSEIDLQKYLTESFNKNNINIIWNNDSFNKLFNSNNLLIQDFIIKDENWDIIIIELKIWKDRHHVTQLMSYILSYKNIFPDSKIRWIAIAKSYSTHSIILNNNNILDMNLFVIENNKLLLLNEKHKHKFLLQKNKSFKNKYDNKYLLSNKNVNEREKYISKSLSDLRISSIWDTKIKLDHLDIKFFLDLEWILYNNLNYNNKYIIDKELLTFNELYSVLSISKAEDSEITINEALEIQRNKTLNKYSEKIKNEVYNLDIKDKDYSYKLKKLYNKLEFANILAWYRYINNNDTLNKIKEDWITLNILQNIHNIVTSNIDEIFKEKWIKNFYPYYSWKTRENNNISIWKYKPIDYKLLPLHIEQINKQSIKINDIDTIFRLHGHLYYSHFFNNWNKRTIRILEIWLLKNLWFSWFLDPNIWYNLQKDNYIKTIVDYSVWKREENKNIDLWKSSIILSALYILDKELRNLKNDILRKFKWVWFEILFLLVNWERIKSKNLKFLYEKKYKKITEQWFYKKLDNEINNSNWIIKREEVWKNVYYSLDLKDEKIEELKEFFNAILGEYKKYNHSYNQIDFLKNY